MFTLAIGILLKAAALLPSVRRAVEGWWFRYAVRQLEQERELWFRARWDLNAARKLRRRLVSRAATWDEIRRAMPRVFVEHPEYLPAYEAMCNRAQAQIAELDDTVRRIYGVRGSAA
jgi:hypothetical protein